MKIKISLTLNPNLTNMKKLILLFAILLGFIGAKAQNPFAELGYEPKIATLSQGQFNESFDNDTIVQIGSVLFNTKSKQIVAFVQTDTMYSEATLQPDIVSRWLSPDPLADHPNLRSWSPYHYAYDNPIKYNDPDGRCPDCFWDAISLGMGVKSLVDNVKQGNYISAVVDGIGVGVDAVALAVPFVPGGASAIIKVVRGGDKAIDLARGMDKTNDSRKALESSSEASKGADFVVSPGGNAAPTSQSRMKEGFEKAGFPSKDTQSAGKEYTLPDGNSVRTMEASGEQGKRAVFQNKNGQPVNQDFKTVNPPKDLSKSQKKDYVRERTHLPQKD